MRFLLIILLAWPNLAIAQNYFCGKQFVTGATGAIEYPLNKSGVFDTAGAEFWINYSQDPSSSPITDGTGNYQFVVKTSPVRQSDGTYPAGLSGTEGLAWDHVAKADGLERADDDSLDPTTLSTFVAVITPLDASNNANWMMKRDPSPANGYLFFKIGTTAKFKTISGGVTIGPDKSSAIAAGQISCMVASVDATLGAGSTTVDLYVDEMPVATSSTCNPIPNTAVPTELGDTYLDTGYKAHYVAYYSDAYWTEAQARDFCRAFYGIKQLSGPGYVATTSATPAATFLSDSGGPSALASTSANTSIIGAHGFYAHPAIDNFVQRSSFESWPTWDEIETAGDGSSSIDQTADATAIHGLSHATITLTGTTSLGTLQSACVTSGIAADLYASAFFKKGSGTTETALRIHEYSDASCTTSIGTTDIVAATDLTTSWVEHGGLFAAATWNGSTAGWEIEIYETCNGGCDSHVDAVQARSASERTDSFCVICDTDATCSCTYANSTIPQPLTAQGWKLTATIRSPIDGASASPVRYVMTVPGTAGNNNRVDIYWASDVLTADVYDSSGTKKTATVAAAGNADTDYDIEIQHTTAGSVTACWDSSCGTPVTAATMDGVSITCRLGNDGTSGGDVWIHDLKVEAL